MLLLDKFVNNQRQCLSVRLHDREDFDEFQK